MINSFTLTIAFAILLVHLALPLIALVGDLFLRKSITPLNTYLDLWAKGIDALNQKVGAVVSVLTLLMVLVQTVVVLERHLFGVNRIWMQESIMYMHAMVFMLAAGYTLLHNGHVRVDIFYREAPPKRKAWVDLAGVYAFIFPVMFVIWDAAFPYVRTSWATGERSPETSGIPAVYILKSLILAFVVLLILQGFSMAIHGVRRLTGRETQSDGAEPAPTF